MNQITFSMDHDFDKNRKRVKFCPCGKNNNDGKFVPYKGYDDRGFCHSCGKTFLAEKSKKSSYNSAYPKPYVSYKKKIKTYSSIDLQHMMDSNITYQSSNLVKYLYSQFDEEVASEAIKKYYLGSFKNYRGSTIFWQIDREGVIRNGKIIQYDPLTGKRTNSITWVHSYLKLHNYSCLQCLFGEHLLTHENKPIMVVESEKTAVIAYIYMPQYTWVATGGKTNLREEYFNNLGDRAVKLIPDTDAHEAWSKKVNDFKRNRNIKVSEVVQSIATAKEIESNWDLEDYLRLHDYRNFNLEMLKERKSTPAISPIIDASLSANSRPTYQYNQPILNKIQKWDDELHDLEEFFSKTSLPTHPIKLNECTVIIDIPTFLEGNFLKAKNYNGTRVGQSCLESLKALKNHLYKL